MEIWDGYYEDETPAGVELIRGQAVPKGLLHLVSEILVCHEDGDYLLMQRDFKKETYPGLYEASAGGSVLKGETPLQGALRELEEETGIRADFLTQIYRKINSRRDAIHYGYLCRMKGDKNRIRLQEGETVSYRWLPREEFLKFTESEKFVPSGRERLSQYLESIKQDCNKIK